MVPFGLLNVLQLLHLLIYQLLSDVYLVSF